MKKILAILCAALLGASAANAVPAKRVWRTFTQPDGSTIELMQAGDEYSHYYLTREGDYVLGQPDGSLRYATVNASGQLTTLTLEPSERNRRSTEVRNLDRKAIEKALEVRAQTMRSAQSPMKALPQNGMGRFTSNYPRTGDVHCLVFLVEYTDVKFKVQNPQEYYNRFCNGDDFSDYGATGSVASYFREQSNGQFRPVYDVFGPVPLKNPRSYYGGNDNWGNDLRPEEMVTEAAEYLKNKIDFSKYDFDNDGYVDNIFVIYAGQGEASYGPAASVWPHSYNLSYTGTTPAYNGKKLDSYTCTNEWEQNNPDGIGTFCHEFSHTMGLPDLYPTSYSNSVSPGEWSVLDYGPYNNDGRTPPNYSIFERNAMGWMEPTLLNDAATITLEEITTNQGCIIQTTKNTEFFLIENRQQTGWDTYVPGHGMLIWHIDFVQSIFDNNKVNNTANHQYVDIVEANGNPNSNSFTAMAGYTYPGTSNKTAFTSTTSPAMKTWSGAAIDVPLTEIREEDGKIIFNVCGGYIELDAPTGLAAEIEEDGVRLSWNAVQDAKDYLVTAYHMNGSEMVVHSSYNAASVGDVTDVLLEGLQGRTEYFFTVQAAAGKFVSEKSAVVSVTTPAIPLNKITPSILEWASTNDNSFTLRWLPIEDAIDYLVTVHSVTLGEATAETADFGTKVFPTLPEGWSVEGQEDYYTSSYFGQALPSFKMGVKTKCIVTRIYPTDVRTISFWLRGISSRNSYLTVLGRENENYDWTVIVDKIDPAPYNDEGKLLNFEIPAGIRQLSLKYTKSVGNIAIDDITLSYAGEDKTLVEGYDRHSVGNTDNHTVEIPASRAETPFAYDAFIEAVDADGIYSKPSPAVRMVKGQSGIVDVIAGEKIAVTVSGDIICYSGTEGTVSLVNASGMTVATTVATGGSATLTAPGAGFYILSTPEGAVKIMINL